MTNITIKPPASIHLIGICGTGMGALAGLLKSKGYTVTGSDSGVYPPMSDELKRLGIPVNEGYAAKNLDHNPDLVVVGNVCRKDHPEAVAALQKGLATASFPKTLHDLFLHTATPIVISGTHGKTTTTSLTAFLLEHTGNDPSVLVGGITKDFGAGYKLGHSKYFVIEGDEYDSAYFEKVPKFLSYAPSAAVVTSVEHDHIDIYPTQATYESAFKSFVSLVSPGPLAVYAGDAIGKTIAQEAQCPVITYGVKGDPLEYEPAWLAKPIDQNKFVLIIEGQSKGQFHTPIIGRHNLRNTLAALIMANKGAKVPLEELRDALPRFGGVARRQQIVGTPNDITIYDDFAHHPTAVRLTLDALKKQHPNGKLIAAFEPRSATACRNLHQQQYAEAFDSADLAIIAPVGRDIPPEDILDTQLLANSLVSKGISAVATHTIEEVEHLIVKEATSGDGVALLSNGAFGAIHGKLIRRLS